VEKLLNPVEIMISQVKSRDFALINIFRQTINFNLKNQLLTRILPFGEISFSNINQIQLLKQEKSINFQ